MKKLVGELSYKYKIMRVILFWVGCIRWALSQRFDPQPKKFKIGKKRYSLDNPWALGVADWQDREQRSLGATKPQTGTVDLKRARWIHKWVITNVRYISDEKNYAKKEYWATSDEVFSRMQDDCDGQAVACWRKLRDAGFPDDKIGICCIEGHAFCVILEGEEDFWILDNGFVTTSFQLASEVLTTKNLPPECVATLWDIYDYQLS